ncbi:MAG: carboxypeptidase-like regulatory domain-containing protein, partial [Bacteroidetes bacterium]|nr:carboxypeptidase-like regulatory domain-containing protein [Bacteroidota bacterium]
MKLQRFTLLIICMTFFLVAAQAQLTQTVRGKVVDSESQFPLEGVTVIVVNSDGIGVYSDEKGEYRLEKVPVGRQTIVFSYLGYQRAILNNIEVTSGKEVILNVQMEASSVQMDSVDIVARRDGEVSNEL